jgi:hypothetical protein
VVTPTIDLRHVDAGDVGFLFELHRASLGPYVDEVWGWRDDEQRAHLAKNLDFDRARVVMVDGLDAGRLDVEESDDRVFIALLELLPSHQGGASAPQSSATSWSALDTIRSR